MKITALIPARSGSKGISGKNIRLLNHYPLLAYSIAAAKLNARVGRVIVSSDSQEILDIARSYGAEAPFVRSSEAASDTANDYDVLLDAMNSLQKLGEELPDYWVYLRPTTPLRDAGVIDQAIGAFLSNPQATSLRSGHPAPESPFKWFKRNEEGYFYGIDPDDTRPEYYNLPRQAFEPVYIPNGYVDIFKTSFVLKSSSLLGDRIMGFVTPPIEEIDTVEQFNYLEYLTHHEVCPLLDFLVKTYPQNWQVYRSKPWEKE